MPGFEQRTSGIGCDARPTESQPLPGVSLFSVSPRMLKFRCHLYTDGFFKKNSAPPGLFFIFVFFTVNSKYVQYKTLPMTGFEPWTSGIGSDALPTEPKSLPYTYVVI